MPEPACHLCGAPLKCPTHSCGTCGHLGPPVNCRRCAGGKGRPCGIDKHGQHVHPDMAACRQWKERPASVFDFIDAERILTKMV